MAISHAKLGWDSLGTSFECACGQTHALPIEACYVGPEAAVRLARFARQRCGTNGVVVSDANTRTAAGDAPYSALSAAGKSLQEVQYPGDDLDATEEIGEALAKAITGVQFVVAVGAGTISDLAKYAGSKLRIPVLLYPTAASMNGYTSGIVALKVRGLKRTLPCRPATGVFADPRVSATAPTPMAAAGIADFLSKASSSTDWRAAHILRGGYYCHRPREFFEGTQEAVLQAAQTIKGGDLAAYQTVLEALMLSGFSMVIAGSSAPASGGEHLISHYLDMKSALYGTPHDLHGAQVGVATVYCLKLWERILEEGLQGDIETLAARAPGEAAIEAMIRDDWPVAVAEQVLAQWRAKRLNTKQLREELRLFDTRLPQLRDECADDLLLSSVVAEAIRAAGGPIDPRELNAPVDEYRKAQSRSRYIRNRFTVLDLAAELGLT